MQTRTKVLSLTALVLAAVVFGMILAGSLDFTRAASADPRRPRPCPRRPPPHVRRRSACRPSPTSPSVCARGRLDPVDGHHQARPAPGRDGHASSATERRSTFFGPDRRQGEPGRRGRAAAVWRDRVPHRGRRLHPDEQPRHRRGRQGRGDRRRDGRLQGEGRRARPGDGPRAPQDRRERSRSRRSSSATPTGSASASG